jgi:hypothetical protein
MTITGTGVNVAGTLNTTGPLAIGSASGGNLTGANVIDANTGNFSANVTALYFLGNGSALTGIAGGGGVSNGTSNISIPVVNGNVNISAVGNANVLVVTGTGANVTGTLNATGGFVLGSATGGNLTGGNVIGANTGNFSANVTASYFLGNGSALTGIAGGSSSNISNGNSNVSITAANGNITLSAVGNANIVVVTGTGVNVAGTLTATGNVTIGPGTGGNLTGATLITANFMAANAFTVNGAASGVPNVATIAGNLGLRTIAATYTDTAVTGTQANAAIHAIATPTITGGTNAKTYTNLATFYIQSNPTASTNATVTNSFAMFVGSGNSFFGGNIIGTLANGNSNVRLATANGNVTIAAVGNTTLTITGTGVNVAGTLNTGTGNLTAGNIFGTLANGTSNVRIAAVNGNVTIAAVGNTTLTITGTGVNVAGNITTTVANGTITSNSHTASGAASGIVNVAATMGNLGFRSAAATYTDTAVTGTQANAAIHYIATPTITGGTNAKTYTNLATFYIQSNPTASTNATATNSYAMFVGSGNSFFGGTITSANLRVSGQGGLGYSGTIGSATQLTSRDTAVTISNVTGAITLFSTTTTANTYNLFTVTNTTVAATDVIILNQRSGSANSYILSVANVAAGSFQVQVYNYLTVAVAEAPLINFAVIKTA